MANTITGNSWYIDTQSTGSGDDLVVKGIRVMRAYLTPTAASAVLILEDTTTGSIVIDLRAATSGDTKEFRFEPNGLYFPNGIKASTLTNAVATLKIAESRG